MNRKTLLAVGIALILLVGAIGVVIITRRTSTQAPLAPNAPESVPGATSCTMQFTVEGTPGPTPTPSPTPSPSCGNGVVDAGEECDAGANNGKDGYACDTFCKLRKRYACNEACDRDTQCNEHVVKLVNKVSGTRNSLLVDGITEKGVLVPDSSGRFIYQGAWSKITTPAENQTDGGSYNVTVANGASVTFSTAEQSIQLRSYVHPERGIIDVYVDGVLKETISDVNVGTGWKNFTIAVSTDAVDKYVCSNETTRACRLRINPTSETCLPATASPSPTPIPQCNTSCINDADCPSSMVCSDSACRNPSCTGESSCVCPTSTPGPTPTPTPAPACNSECTTNAQCPSDLICQSNRCRRPGCTAVDSCTCGSPSPTPQSSCGSSCLSDSDCPSSMVCSGSLCRNPSCTDSSTCTCSTTPPVASVPPTESLPVAGGPLPTIGLVSAGVFTIIIGILGLLAL